MDRFTIAIIGMTFLCFAPTSGSEGTVLGGTHTCEPCRGVALVSSNIGATLPVDEVLDFAESCDLNLVIVDFAWITHHWPRTDKKAVERLCAELKKRGVDVAVMYRPRVLRPSEADVHYAESKDGAVADSHNELCFAREDSQAWGAAWGAKLLEALPSISRVILYNLRSPCHCPLCREGKGRSHVADFLERCRREWSGLRPGLEIGHVGLGAEYEEQVDLLYPFLPLIRQGGSAVDVSGHLERLAGLKSTARAKPVVPLVKIDWGTATNTTTEDVIDSIRQCEDTGSGFILWHYDRILHDGDGRYDAKAVVTALGGDWDDLARHFPKRTAQGRPKSARGSPNHGLPLKVPRVASPTVRPRGETPSEEAPLDLTFPHEEGQVEKLPWPHQPPGLSPEARDKLNREVWVINDFPLYQADPDGHWRYFHGGLDVVLKNGAKIYAIKDGWVKSLRNSSIVIADAEDDSPCYGWEYTHLANLQVSIGTFVERGTWIGDVNFRGLPHVHLAKVFSEKEHWGDWVYVCAPNAHFTYVDEDPPWIENPFLFFENNSDERIKPSESGVVTLSGAVDVVVGMRDGGQFAHDGERGFGDRLGIAGIGYEITPLAADAKGAVRFQSFDFRKLKIKKAYHSRTYGTELTKVVFKHWKLFEPSRESGSKTTSYYVITNCPGNEPPRELDLRHRKCCWNTGELDDDGKPVFPNGTHEIKVTAVDFAGNASSAVMRVEVANGPRR
ncbi:MAG: M23 family metallopeptidase [Planctomycetes bacterium]|nr:M23 family metallopeptidase [Planctomycetota bacterium]